jgi:hypothetical protein
MSDDDNESSQAPQRGNEDRVPAFVIDLTGSLECQTEHLSGMHSGLLDVDEAGNVISNSRQYQSDQPSFLKRRKSLRSLELQGNPFAQASLQVLWARKLIRFILDSFRSCIYMSEFPSLGYSRNSLGKYSDGFHESNGADAHKGKAGGDIRICLAECGNFSMEI